MSATAPGVRMISPILRWKDKCTGVKNDPPALRKAEGRGIFYGGILFKNQEWG